MQLSLTSAVLALCLSLTSAEATKESSPFDVTFHGPGEKAGSGSSHETLPSSVLTGAAQNGPFRQQTNGSTPAGWIQIGTPKKWLFVIMDTGSDKLVAKTWETLSHELSTVDQGIDGMVLPSGIIYDHDSSTSYQRKFTKDLTGKDRPQSSSITYGSGTAITDVGTETVLVGNRTLANYTLMEITADSLQLLHTSKGIAGVLGLQHMKNKSLGNSLFSRMRDNDELTSFGYCRGSGNNGTFIWGDDSEEGTEIPVIGQMHWAMKLEGVKVPSGGASLLAKNGKGAQPGDWASWPFSGDMGGADDGMGGGDDGMGGGDTGGADMDDPATGLDPNKILDEIRGLDDIFKKRAASEAKEAVQVLADICTDQKCTAILDTGSNIIAGPAAAMKSITSLVNLKSDCSNYDQLPNIALRINGLDLSVPPSGYVMKVPMPDMDTTAMDQDAGASAGEDGFGRGMEGDFREPSSGDAAGLPVDVIIEVEPGYVRRHQNLEMGLTEKTATTVHAQTQQRWREVFARLHRNSGVDLRDVVDEILQQQNHTDSKFMCMPALVPLDKPTQYGPLWVVGTPLLDAYYARWSWAKKDDSPKIHLKPLKDADVCKIGQTQTVTPGLLRKEDKEASPKSLVASRAQIRGPTVRLPEEIAYPHWARDLLHI